MRSFARSVVAGAGLAARLATGCGSRSPLDASPPRGGEGSSSSGGAGGSSGSTGGGSSGGGSSSGSSGGGSSSGTGSGSSGSSGGGGFINANGDVYIDQCEGDATCVSLDEIGGGFHVTAPPYGGCSAMTGGACTVFDCGSAPPVQDLSAGQLTVGGGRLAAPIVLAPRQDGSYGVAPNAVLFDSGQTLWVQASGGQLAPFGPVYVTAPPPVTLIQPPPTPQMVISSATDLQLVWSGGLPGNLVIVEGESSPSFHCEFDAAAGAGSVPAWIINAVGIQGFLAWGQAATTTLTDGAYTLGVHARAYQKVLVVFH